MSNWTDQIKANQKAIQKIILEAKDIAGLPALSEIINLKDVVALKRVATGQTVKSTVAQLMGETTGEPSVVIDGYLGLDSIIYGEALQAGNLVYLDTDGKYYKASNIAESTSTTELRLILEAGILNDEKLALAQGRYTGTGFTAGNEYVGTNGTITSSRPILASETVRIVSTAINATTRYFSPSKTWVSGDGSKSMGVTLIGTSAETTATDTTNFNNNLSELDTDVQKALDTLDDLIIYASTDTNELIQKGFNHVIDFDWYVFAQVYRFNGIVTNNLVTDTVTLDPAPLTVDFKRFDIVVFNDDFTFIVIKGTEGLSPAIPYNLMDFSTQIELTVILVEYGTTTPTYLTKDLMYDEGVGTPTEFNVTTAGTGVTLNSLEQSSSGTKSIKVSLPNAATRIFINDTATFNTGDVDTISFKVKNGNVSNHNMFLYSYNIISGFYQGTVNIKHGKYGFDKNNITTWQTIIIPISDITSPVDNTGFALAFFNSAQSILYFDEFALNGNFTTAPIQNPVSHVHNNFSLLETINQTMVNAWNSASSWVVANRANVLTRLSELTNVDNTSDADKPISTATADALALKLDASAYNERFKGVHLSEVALRTAHPTANVGDRAQVNEVGALTVVNYSWDGELADWVATGSVSGGALNTDELPEGTSNLYFTGARVLATLLTGISFLTGTAVVAGDSILIGFGKLQKQITDLIASVALKANKYGTRTVLSGTAIDWATDTDTYTKTLTTATTLTDVNLPQGTNTKTIVLSIDGAFALTVPIYWKLKGGTYSTTKVNQIVLQCVNGISGSERVNYQINPDL